MEGQAARRVAIGGLCASAGLGLWLWYSHRRGSEVQQKLDAAENPAGNPRANAGNSCPSARNSDRTVTLTPTVP